MMISTRGCYALRVLIDLAEHADIEYVPNASNNLSGIDISFSDATL